MDDPKALDEWPSRNNKIADAAHVHAIGQFSLAYNNLEELFGYVFQCTFPAGGDYSEILFHSLNNRERVDMLEALFRFHDSNNKELFERVLYALRCFDICTANRNVVMHAVTDHEAGSTPELLRLRKKAHNNPLRNTSYEVPLEMLRKVADDTMVVFDYWAKLFFWLSDRRDGKKLPPLPDKPPQPYRLNPSPLVEADANKRSPPQPSRA